MRMTVCGYNGLYLAFTSKGPFSSVHFCRIAPPYDKIYVDQGVIGVLQDFGCGKISTDECKLLRDMSNLIRQ